MITGYYQQFLRRTLYIYTKKLYSAVGLLSGVSVRFLRDDALCPAGLHLSSLHAVVTWNYPDMVQLSLTRVT